MKSKLTRFSDYFNLGKNQTQLDFVDIPIETDIPLYLDPYALHVSSEDWLRECGNDVVRYFELLVEKIRQNETSAVLQLLDNFHEPNETHLGKSSGRPSGRGWGATQAKQLLNVLTTSSAVKTGTFADIADYEMFIPGIGEDKISDLTTNIIKGELLLYTEEQCSLLNIPNEKVNAGKCWSSSSGDFASRYADLPICPSGPIILVPKLAVRTRLLPDRDKFYSRFVLDYLEAELISANDSLVKVLKNGKKKVFRDDLKQKYQFTSEQLLAFSQRHPEVFRKYKASLPEKAKPISDLDIEWTQREQRSLDTAPLMEGLKTIPTGAKDASKYHDAILGILQALFYPQLTRPVKEQEINEGRKRIDIRFSNSSERGFFAHLVNRHNLNAPYVVVECKNYKEDPENPELDQLIARFSKKRGDFGLLVCRSLDKPELMLKRCRDIVNDGKGVIIVLDDGDIDRLLSAKSTRGETGVSDYMQTKLDELLM